MADACEYIYIYMYEYILYSLISKECVHFLVADDLLTASKRRKIENDSRKLQPLGTL